MISSDVCSVISSKVDFKLFKNIAYLKTYFFYNYCTSVVSYKLKYVYDNDLCGKILRVETTLVHSLH